MYSKNDIPSQMLNQKIQKKNRAVFEIADRSENYVTCELYRRAIRYVQYTYSSWEAYGDDDDSFRDFVHA